MGTSPARWNSCRPGLELHPDYIPASIVLGRCHLGLGDLPAAETAFTHVLALDGENVIALKALADINERLHHFDIAERWLHQLLSLDRSNDEAREQLERIETARVQASEVAARSSVAVEPVETQVDEAAVQDAPVEEVTGEVTTEVVTEEEVELVPVEAPLVPLEEPPLPPPLALEELEFSRLDTDVNEPPPIGLETEELDLVNEPTDQAVEPLAGLIGRDVEEGVEDGWAVETSEDIVLRSSGGSEFQVPDASQELFTSRHAPDPSPFGESKPVETPAEPAEEPPPRFVELSALAESAPEPEAAPEPEPVNETPAADLVAHAEPHTVVTETMAQVLQQQGHSEDALRVYRELEVRGGGDERLRRRIAELEGSPGAEPAGEPVSAAKPESAAAPESAAKPEPAPARQRLTASETHGESVASFFGKLLAARLPGGESAPVVQSAPRQSTPETDAGGAPTRPAADALSLSSVFGEEPTTHPPAVPAPGHPRPASLSTSSTVPRARPPVPGPPAAPTPRTTISTSSTPGCRI